MGTLFLMIYTNIWLTLVTLVLIPVMMKAAGMIAARSQKYFLPSKVPWVQSTDILKRHQRAKGGKGILSRAGCGRGIWHSQ